MQGLTEGGCEIVDLIADCNEGLVGWILFDLQVGSVLHGANHGFDEAEGVERGLFAGQVVLPEVTDCSVRGFKLLDEAAVVVLADEVASDEAG
jgi:hypothetical protein